MPELWVNGRTVEFSAGETVLDAARRGGCPIPTLCHHPDLPNVGSCRICLVEIEGSEHLVPACKHPASPGLNVLTDSAMVRHARRLVLQMLVDQGGFRTQVSGTSHREGATRPLTEFEQLLAEYEVTPSMDLPDRYPRDADPSPFLHVDLNQCILCTRCIRACADVQGRFVWGIASRGHLSHIEAGAGVTLEQAGCEGCGACVAYCPTGALSDRVALFSPPIDQRVKTTCAYCGVGCQFDLNVANDRVVQVTSNPSAPVNGMHLCVKGRYGFDYIHHPDRLTRPRVRRELLEGLALFPDVPRGDWVDVDWDTAYEIITSKLTRIHRESGGDAVGFFSSAKCTNEENYLVQKIARQIFGTHNIDHCARLCHSSTVAGLGMAVGSGAMSNSLDDLAEQAALYFVIGSNTTEQHPVFGSMLRQAVHQRGAQLIVADPRRIDLVDFATLHLRHRPGTDIPLLNGLMHLILNRGWHNETFIRERCENFEAVRDSLASYPPERVSALTGLSIRELETAAEMLGTLSPAAVIWAMGITQHITGVMNVLALANLQLMLGNFGVPGSGVNPLRGQNNVQGACDMGALPNVFTGYQPVTDLAVGEKFKAAWKLEHATVEFPTRPGYTLTEMLHRAGTRELRGLYLIGENPVLTDPDSSHVREALGRAEFIVLQEIFPSATSEYADVLLPGTTFAERDGTFTNTERRVQRVQQAIPTQGESRADWIILAELGQRLLQKKGASPVGPYAGYDYASPEEIMEEIRSLTPSYAGVTYERLRQGDRLQWPVRDTESPGTPILHTRQFTRGRGRFHPVEHLEPHELPDAEYPFLLTTGRILYHWHAGEMTHRSRGLHAAAPRALVELSVEDAGQLSVVDGDEIVIASRRGEMRAGVMVTDRVSPGLVFANFHFPPPFNANELTHVTLDPIAQIPEFKVSAVRLGKLEISKS